MEQRFAMKNSIIIPGHYMTTIVPHTFSFSNYCDTALIKVRKMARVVKRVGLREEVQKCALSPYLNLLVVYHLGCLRQLLMIK